MSFVNGKNTRAAYDRERRAFGGEGTDGIRLEKPGFFLPFAGTDYRKVVCFYLLNCGNACG